MRSTPAALLALAGGAVAYTTRPSSAARISAFAAFADPKMQKEKAEGPVADCSKCGRARGGALNCCSAGGAWAGTCTDALSDGGEHTWAEGFVACKAAAQEEALSHSEYVAAAPVGGMDDMAPVGGMDDMADLPELTPSQHETLKSTQAAMGRADSAALENCKDDDPEQCPAWAQLGLNTVLIASRSLRNPVLGENAATFLIVQKEGSGGVTVYTSNEYRQLHRYRTPIRTLDRVDIKLMSVFADEGTLSTQGFPVDLVLRITHTPI